MYFIRTEMSTTDMFLHVYGGISREGLEQKINALLTNWGYKLKGGENGCVMYEKGRRAARIWLGALAKYAKISVRIIVASPDELKCEIRSQSSGISGGLIGVNQMNTEIRNLFTAFQYI